MHYFLEMEDVSECRDRDALNFRRAEGWQFLFLCAEQGIIKRAGIWRSSYFIEGGMFQSAEGALF